MERLLGYLEEGRLEPHQLLPHITKWICEKGSAQQLIEWVNGLSAEKEEIFRALDLDADGSSTLLEDGDRLVEPSEDRLPIEGIAIHTKVEDDEEGTDITIS